MMGIAIRLHSAKIENVLACRMFSAVDGCTRTVTTMHTKHQRDMGVKNQVMWYKYFIKRQLKQRGKIGTNWERKAQILDILQTSNDLEHCLLKMAEMNRA
jgi:pyocin large subunit-like protein